MDKLVGCLGVGCFAIIIYLLMLIGSSLAIGFLVMIEWNLFADAINANHLSFWQSFGIVLIISLVVSTIRGVFTTKSND